MGLPCATVEFMPRPASGSRRAGASVVEAIQELIVERRLAPGDPMPTESELVAELGASRSSVREAIKTLSALDIVEVRHGFGTYVGGMSMRALVDALAFRARLAGETDHGVLLDVVDVRETLEQGLAARIVAGLDAQDRLALRSLADAMRERAAAGESYLEEDRAFHARLLRSLGNEVLVQLSEACWLVQARVVPGLHVDAREAAATADAHAGIVDALDAGDAPRLVAALAEHYAPIRRQVRVALHEGGVASSP